MVETLRYLLLVFVGSIVLGFTFLRIVESNTENIGRGYTYLPQAMEFSYKTEQEDVCEDFKELGCAVVWESSEKINKGELIAQSPPAGTVIKEGSYVQLVYSSGSQRPRVPDVVGLPLEYAKQKMYEAGLELDYPEDGNENAKVADMKIKVGQQLFNGDKVEVSLL